jgi:hypothetical protein
MRTNRIRKRSIIKMINKEAKSSREKRKELNLMKKRNLSL